MSTDLATTASAEVVAQGRIHFTETGAEIPADITYEEWEAAVEFALRVEKTSRWWIGDLLIFKGGEFGEMYLAAADSGLSYSSLGQAKHVAGQFDFFRRRKNLPWSHHSELAKLPKEEQDAWLDIAEEETLSQKALRERLREGGETATYFGKGDKWEESTDPLGRYLRGQRNRNFDFSHLNWKEAKKRVQRIDGLIADLEAARADLEPRSHKPKLSF